MGDFSVIFESVPDPRDINARHDLRDMLFIALAAMLCGAESCVEMAEFGGEKEALLRTILELKHGIPSHDTFSRVLRRLDPIALESAFTRFMEAFRRALGSATGRSVLAIDGKSLKSAYEKGRAHMPPMMVSVWGVTMRMTFAQTQAGTGGEAEAAIRLLESVSLKGCVVTADAIHCDRRVVETVKQRGGDYVIALKLNQRKLLASVTALFEAAPPPTPDPRRPPRRVMAGKNGARSSSSPHPASRPLTASRASPPSRGWSASARSTAKQLTRNASTSHPAGSRRSISLRSSAVIGTSKMEVIGSRTSYSTKTSPEIERTMVREILRSSGGSPPISSKPTPTRLQHASNDSKPPGTKTSSSTP